VKKIKVQVPITVPIKAWSKSDQTNGVNNVHGTETWLVRQSIHPKGDERAVLAHPHAADKIHW
jgi:hypothetical protein